MESIVTLNQEKDMSSEWIEPEVKIELINEVYDLMNESVDVTHHGTKLGQALFENPKIGEASPSKEKQALKNFLCQFQIDDPVQKTETVKKIQAWMSDVAEYIQKDVLEPLMMLDVSNQMQIHHKNDFIGVNLGSPDSGLNREGLKNLILALKEADDTAFNDGRSSFNVANVKTVVEQLVLFRTILPRVKPYFAIKSCPDEFLVRFLTWLNTGFDCASWNEIQHVKKEFDKLRQLIISAKMMVDNSLHKKADFLSLSEEEENVIALSDSEIEESLVNEHPQVPPKMFPRIVGKNNEMAALFLKHLLGVNYKQEIQNHSVEDMFDKFESGREDDGLFGRTLEERRIVYAHPCKLKSHIRQAMDVNVGYTTLDNVIECEKIAKIQKETGKPMKVLIRIATHDQNSLMSFSSKYGARMTHVDSIINACVDHELEIAGCSFHVGSGCPSPQAYFQALSDVSEIFGKVRKLSNGKYDPKMIDIGGGFFGHSVEAFFDVANKIRPMIDELFPESEGYHIIAEPGRFFSARLYTLVTEAYAIREIPEQEKNTDPNHLCKWLYLNDSTYHSFNCIIFDHYEFAPLVIEMGERKKGEFNYKVFGCTCDSMDMIEKCWKSQSEVKEGDIIFFENMGAYSMSASTRFNGFDVTPAKYIWM